MPGTFQSEMGCSADWDPACLRAWLQDPDGDGVYVFTTTGIPAGVYEGKVAAQPVLGAQRRLRGTQDGANYSFTVPEASRVTFSYDTDQPRALDQHRACLRVAARRRP